MWWYEAPRTLSLSQSHTHSLTLTPLALTLTRLDLIHPDPHSIWSTAQVPGRKILSFWEANPNQHVHSFDLDWCECAQWYNYHNVEDFFLLLPLIILTHQLNPSGSPVDFKLNMYFMYVWSIYWFIFLNVLIYICVYLSNCYIQT